MYKYAQITSMYQTKTTVFRCALQFHAEILKSGGGLKGKISVIFTTVMSRNWDLAYETSPELKPWT
jgi:hypothetical protein